MPLGQVGSMSVALLGDINSFNRTMDGAGNKISAFGTKVASAGKAMTLGITAPLIAIGTASVIAFDKQAQALAQVEQGIISTGGACGFTIDELAKIASGLQEITVFGDEEILSGVTAQLLTFANIVGPQFEQAQVAVMDLATRLGTDLKSAAIQVGKALNDPITGLSMLGRSGITFSEDQKTLIKSLWETGRQAEAQNVILEELAHQYGGSAEAAVAGAGKIKQLKNEVGDLSEEFGGLIVEAMGPFIEKLREMVSAISAMSPEQKERILKYLAIFAVGGPALWAVGTITKLVPALYSLWGAISASPIGAMVALVGIAAAAGPHIATIYDFISDKLGDLTSQEQEAIKVTQAVVDNFVAATAAAGDSILNNILATSEVVDALVSDFQAAQAEAVAVLEAGTRYDEAVGQFADSVEAILDKYGIMDETLRGQFRSMLRVAVDTWAEVTGVTGEAAEEIVEDAEAVSDAVAEVARVFTTLELDEARAEFEDLRDQLAETEEGSYDYIFVVGKIAAAYKKLIAAEEDITAQGEEVRGGLADLIAEFEALGLVLEQTKTEAKEWGSAYKDVISSTVSDIAWDLATFHRDTQTAEKDHWQRMEDIEKSALGRLADINKSDQEKREDEQLSYNRRLEDIEMWYQQQVLEGAANTNEKRLELEAEKAEKLEEALLAHTRRLEDLDIDYTRSIEDNEADREHALDDEVAAYEEQRPKITAIVEQGFKDMVNGIVESGIDTAIQNVIDGFWNMATEADSAVTATNAALAGLDLGPLAALAVPLLFGATSPEVTHQFGVQLDRVLRAIFGIPPTQQGTIRVESYAGGGVVPGPVGMPVLVEAHGGEPIGIDYEAIENAVRAGTADGMSGRAINVYLPDGTRLARALYRPLEMERARRGG